jgi:hypothetical protein
LSVEDPVAPGLPPITPPSARFLAQLFLVPGLIVVVAVAILLGFSWLVGLSRSPERFLQDLKSDNPDVRWRAASDLAQVLKRDPVLASNPHFCLDLADLLEDAIRDDDQAGRRKSVPSSPGAAPEPTPATRFVQYLMNCLGSCNVPVGISLLSGVANTDSGLDPQDLLLRRQGAVWSLANLAARLNQIDQIPADRKKALLDALDEEIVSSSGPRSARARAASQWFREGPAVASDNSLLPALQACAASDDPVLRKIVALVLNLWPANPAIEPDLDAILLKLSYDHGHGGGDESRVRGVEIRFKAAEGLARRGAPAVADRFALFDAMLDPAELATAFRVKDARGREETDETAVVSTLTSAMRALVQLHRRRPQLDLHRFGPALGQLAESKNALVRQEAVRTRPQLDSVVTP